MSNITNSRRIIIAGNWKMHKTRAEAVELSTQIVEAVRGKVANMGVGQDAKKNLAKGIEDLPQIILFPPFTSLEYVATAVKGTDILVGAQTMNQHKNGGFTGEISADMIIDCGACAVLVGHSERRHLFHETDADVHAKLQKALEKNLIAVLCVGEKLEEKASGRTDEVIERQLLAALRGITCASPDNLIIAYEPVWSIGTGEVCKPEEANRVTGKIREMLKLNTGIEPFFDKVPILYGGSVKPANVAAQLEQENIDGVLVGGASLTASEFVPIIEAGMRCYQVECARGRL